MDKPSTFQLHLMPPTSVLMTPKTDEGTKDVLIPFLPEPGQPHFPVRVAASLKDAPHVPVPVPRRVLEPKHGNSAGPEVLKKADKVDLRDGELARGGGRDRRYPGGVEPAAKVEGGEEGRRNEAKSVRGPE